MNEVYSEFFTTDFPARAAFEVSNLPLCAKGEIEMIAFKNDWRKIMLKIEARNEILNIIPYVPGKPIEDVKREYGLDHVDCMSVRLLLFPYKRRFQ